MILWLISLTACSATKPVALEQVLPVLPSYPGRPCIIFSACQHGVVLPLDDAVLLRDWLIMEDAWRGSVTEIWNLYVDTK